MTDGNDGRSWATTHFSGAAPSNVTQGVAFNVTVTAFDLYNNTATNYGGAVHFTSSGPRQRCLPTSSDQRRRHALGNIQHKTSRNHHCDRHCGQFDHWLDRKHHDAGAITKFLGLLNS